MTDIRKLMDFKMPEQLIIHCLGTTADHSLNGHFPAVNILIEIFMSSIIHALCIYSRMRKTDMRKTDTFSEISRTFDMRKSDTFSEISRFFFQNIGKMTFDLFNLFWNYNFHCFQQT